MVDHWDEQGDKIDPRPEIRAEVAALTPAAVQEYLARLARVPALTGVTGDKARLALPALSKLGRIEEVPVARLYSYGAFPSEPAAVAKH